MDFTIIWLLGILLLDQIFYIGSSSLSLKYQTCMSEKINGFHLYTGTQSYTKSGYPCERWDALNPLYPIAWTIMSQTTRIYRTLQHNYCRTMYPDKQPVPWCYTTNKNKEWEECGIRECDFDSENDKYQTCTGKKINGYYPYNGIKSITKSGFTCQRWDSMKPQPVRDMIVTLGRTFLTLQHNYCRTMYPDDQAIPWCYTDSQERWEECGIPMCNTDMDTVLISRFKPITLETSYENENYPNEVDGRNEIKLKNMVRHHDKWEIDLLQMSKIRHVILFSVDIRVYFDDNNRKIAIHIGDGEYNNWDKCVDFDGPGNNISSKHKFVCEGVAQYVRVEIFHFGHIQLQGVDVFGYQYGDSLFLLFNKSALFISTSNDKDSSPGVVGLIDTKFTTLLSWKNFWKVNLLKRYIIRYVILHNIYTGHNYSHDILKIAVYLENKDQRNSTRCAYFEAEKEESRNVYRFICEGIGQYIRVEKSKFCRFQLQEVEVFGYTYDDSVCLSQNKPVSITPKYEYNTSSSGRQNYTWEVNLLRMCKTMYVILPSIGDFQKIAIYIGGHEPNNWDRCSLFESSTNLTKKHKFDCEGIGQYIRVKIFDLDHFKSQELKVFGIQYEDDILLLYNKSALFFAEYGNEMPSPGAEISFDTISKTRLNWKNFWKVNLLKMFEIKYVILHNGYPVTQSANSNLTIAVYLENSEQKYSTRCAYYHRPEDKSMTLYRFICEAIGQYIRVEKSQLGHFELQEIEVYGYLYYDDALLVSQGKPTFMASTYENEYSSHGVDGKKYTKFKTLPNQYNKWEVNILRLYILSHVILTTVENDSNGFRNIGVYYGDKEHTNWENCSYFDYPREKTRKYYVPCVGIAQYIRVDKSYKGVFQLEEVEAFGYNIDSAILISSKKPTSMTTTHKNDMSLYGVDGNINSKFKTAYHDNHNYWEVDLRKMFKIRYVTIYASDSKEAGIGDFRKISIHVSDASKHTKVTCANFDGPGEKSRTIYRLICEGFGQHVRIERAFKGYLALQEVEVYGINDDAILLSKGRPTTMSSAAHETQYNSSCGVDGRNDTKFKTSLSLYNNWEVELHQIYKISHITITNVDTHEHGLRKIGIYIGSSKRDNWDKCAYYEGPGELSVKYWFACEGIGQFIRVDKYLFGHFQLQEVEVFGYEIQAFLVSVDHVTFMSSTFQKDISSRGVDRDYDNKFKTLFSNHSNYWAVDLNERHNISYVALYTVQHIFRSEFTDLRNVSIYISKGKDNIHARDRCAYFGGPEDRSRTVYNLICEGFGQYVRVERGFKGHLELNEVEVYGKVVLIS